MNFLLAPRCSDDKREAASEASIRLRPAGESVWGEVWQQPAAAGGRWEGSAPHRPQLRRQELQQEEHLQPTQVKQQTLAHSHHVRAWLDDPQQQLPRSLSVGIRETLPLRGQNISLASWISMKKGDGGAFEIVLGQILLYHTSLLNFKWNSGVFLFFFFLFKHSCVSQIWGNSNSSRITRVPFWPNILSSLCVCHLKFPSAFRTLSKRWPLVLHWM